MSDSQEYNPLLGCQIYDEGHKLWMNAITTSNRFGPGIDYDNLKKKDCLKILYASRGVWMATCDVSLFKLF